MNNDGFVAFSDNLGNSGFAGVGGEIMRKDLGCKSTEIRGRLVFFIPETSIDHQVEK